MLSFPLSFSSSLSMFPLFLSLSLSFFLFFLLFFFFLVFSFSLPSVPIVLSSSYLFLCTYCPFLQFSVPLICHTSFLLSYCAILQLSVPLLMSSTPVLNSYPPILQFSVSILQSSNSPFISSNSPSLSSNPPILRFYPSILRFYPLILRPLTPIVLSSNCYYIKPGIRVSLWRELREQSLEEFQFPVLSAEYGGLGLGRIQSRSHVFYHPALPGEGNIPARWRGRGEGGRSEDSNQRKLCLVSPVRCIGGGRDIYR